MEFLNTIHHTGDYWFGLVLCGVMFVFVTAATLWFVWTSVKEKEYGWLWLSLVLIPVAWIYGSSFIQQINSEPEVTHKVLITDFNEVYNQGYEIIGQEGEIYTIQKKTGD